MSSSPLLPSSKQVWSHSTCTQKQLSEALANQNLTAIETDLLLGSLSNSGASATTNDEELIPIMAHPPDKISELSTKDFLRQVTTEDGTLKKIIKLDFKEMGVVSPTLEEIIRQGIRKGVIFLNADIIPGPGRDLKDIDLPPEEFLPFCLDFIRRSKRNSPTLQLIFSIGFKADVLSLRGYSQSHIENMIDLVREYDLVKHGVVLPINARLLVKNTAPFRRFLRLFPDTQILAWTATGEPPISLRKVKKIESQFADFPDAPLGFDCVVANGNLMGYFYDYALETYAVWLFIFKFLIIIFGIKYFVWNSDSDRLNRKNKKCKDS